MVKALIVAVVMSAWAPTAALAQAWQGYKATSADESPLELKLQGWGKAAIKAAGYDKGPNSNNTGDVYFYTIRAEDKDYRSFVGINESSVFRIWNQDTLQNYAGRYFKNQTIEFGELDDIYNGRAQFKFIPFNYTENNVKNNCSVFRSTWDYLASVGWFCAKPGKSLSLDAIKTFITHISFKQNLTPKDEGVLPTP
ncbi:MAG: hypothetical protein ACOVQ8_01910 [Elstera sp.]|jgi:hypothetical protein|uniref:hypothetical protein n=1 Tax=Elstera sp. TaxID=1916664 RepID=UPI0037C1456B